MGKNQWVTTRGDKYALIGEGNSKPTKLFDKQYEAIEAGTKAAKKQKSELIIQGRNTKIRKKTSYGNDDFPPKG